MNYKKHRHINRSFLLAIILLGISTLTNAQNTILEARNMAVGTVVTVKGIVTNGSEFGPIRYFQDNTAGIAAYGTSVNNVQKGDSITVTGTLKNYNGLLELDPLTSLVILSSGNQVPEPIALTPAQIGETYEGRLVQINNATFTDAGATFAGDKTYEITANGESVNIFVKTGQNDIIGQPIPTGEVEVTAISSQYYNTYNSPPPGYQLLPRTIADIQKTSVIYLIGSLNNTNFTKTELDFTWSTNIVGTSEMFYGTNAESVTTNKTSSAGELLNHSISLSGLNAGEIIWVQAFSVNGNDTAFSGITPFATISNSSGDIKVYFNTPVDNSYSTGVDAIYLNQSIDDTLINYINRAKHSIDLAIYNFNNSGISNISNALIAAANRGVTVRVLGCGTTGNFGIEDLAGSAVNTFIGPNDSQRTGIMHNKFFLFDTDSDDPNEPLVWTGSTNLTSGNINLDANNVIIIQDQSLARAYKIEFEEMWGSNTSTANATNALFGFNKKNNTPHEFVINGKRVESYFSPTDGVNAKIVQTIETTDNDLRIATMLLTRDEIANAIASKYTDIEAVNMLTNTQGNNGSSVNTTLLAALGTTNYVFYTGNAGTMHNKYMIVDQGDSNSDPLILTGSHNWSAAANNDNDENTIIVHDATIANIYYQNFATLFVASSGELTAIEDIDISKNSNNDGLEVFPNPVRNGNVSLSLLSTSSEIATLQLIDLTGKLVFKHTINLTKGENTLNYNFPDSYKGIYVLRLITTNKVWNQKLLFK